MNAFNNVEITSRRFRARLTVGGDYNALGSSYVVESIKKPDVLPGLHPEVARVVTGTVEIVFRCKKTGVRYRTVNNHQPASVMMASVFPDGMMVPVPRGLQEFVSTDAKPTFSNPVKTVTKIR